MSRHEAKLLKLLEASTGIEPVWTDLQSSRFPNEITAQELKKYQDKAGTHGEPDTPVNLNIETKIPGAAATATGELSRSKVIYEEAAQLPLHDTALIEARHPILSQHWGALA